MVSEYKNNQCKYRIDKLDNIVYLIDEQSLRNIIIDTGEAYINNIAQTPIYFHCYNISLEDTETLDERYAFSHTLKFSVNGYVNYQDFEGKYYAIVKSIDNEYWLLNPMFPCKVTFTYTLGYNDNHTDFTLSTISNHPTLRVHNMQQSRPYPCNEYLLDGIDRLFLNEKKYSARNGNDVHYTNDGFKEIIYDKKSCTFTEQFDGNNVSHSIQFNIKFDDYKDSWHYNLLEFTENLYAAVITTTKGEYVLCGFGFGLQPSFTVTSNDESTPDYIQINLVDMHDNGDLITFISGGSISGLSATTYQYTLDHNGWECVREGYAKYLLKEEVDALGNPTGNYMCLEGYEEQFEDLNIVGTFDETEEFINSDCHSEGCNLYTNMLSPVRLTSQQCKAFTIKADTNWYIANSASFLSITPTSGNANTEYTVGICSTRSPEAAPISSAFTISYCNTAQTFVVDIDKGNGCFNNYEYNIDAEGQYVTIPTECCVLSAENSGLTNIQLFDNYIKVYVPANDEGSGRTFDINITLCNGSGDTVTINQSEGYVEWVTEGYTCDGTQKCEIQRKYTGTTSDDINFWTDITRTANCVDSYECGGVSTRWIESDETTCYLGRKYIVEVEQYRGANDSEWINTGNERRGYETVDSPAECSGETTNEWRVEGTTCDGYTLYELQRLYISNDSGTTWEATEITRKGVVLEYDSPTCGYEPPSGDTYYEWRVVGTDCDGFDLYQREEKYVSYDGNEWSPTGTYRYGALIEVNSTQCGWTPPIQYEYRWILTSATTCVGYDKYYLYQQQQRISGSSDAWVNVIPTTTSVDASGTEPPSLAESASTECGYQPEVEPIYKWVNMSIATDYYCDVCPLYRWVVMSGASDYTCSGTTKYTKEKKQVSFDSGTTWEDVVPEETRSGSTVIEYDSEDCGYVPPTPSYSGQYLTFVALEDGTFKFRNNSVEYSLDSGATWTTIASNTDSPTVQSGHTIMWKATLTPTNSGIGRFISTGTFTVEGNPMSLLFGDNFIGQTSLNGKDNAFLQLFSGCTNLISAENLSLPATTLADSCYYWMFYKCTNLTTAPSVLPATTLANLCYFGMFDSCTSLTTAPQLLATTLANSCCYYMFFGCTALTTAPDLLATTLADECYAWMFCECTALTSAPILSATTLANYCYQSMFEDCYSLTTAPVLPATTLAEGCYQAMFSNCWSLNNITCLATDISATDCTTSWVVGVAPSGTFTKAASMTSWTTGYNGIPNNWTVINN